MIALCPNHHALADAKVLSYQQLWDIVRERLLGWLSDGLATEEVYVNSIAYIDRHYAEA